MLIETLHGHFDSLDSRQRALVNSVSEGRLFWSPISSTDSMLTLSVGGGVLRSAAMVEQVFLGITRRLWDDPFEWTLPEKISTKKAIMRYLGEVVEARNNGLAFITSDGDLSRRLPAPEMLKPILQVLVEAVARAENYLGQAEAVAKMLT
jgi:hypothetical protein